MRRKAQADQFPFSTLQLVASETEWADCAGATLFGPLHIKIEPWLGARRFTSSLERGSVSGAGRFKIKKIGENRMKSGEMRTMNATIKGVWKYLSENVPEDGRYISYATMRDVVGKSRHAVAYAVEKLIRMGKIRIYDEKIHVLEKYKEAI